MTKLIYLLFCLFNNNEGFSSMWEAANWKPKIDDWPSKFRLEIRNCLFWTICTALWATNRWCQFEYRRLKIRVFNNRFHKAGILQIRNGVMKWIRLTRLIPSILFVFSCLQQDNDKTTYATLRLRPFRGSFSLVFRKQNKYQNAFAELNSPPINLSRGARGKQKHCVTYIGFG